MIDNSKTRSKKKKKKVLQMTSYQTVAAGLLLNLKKKRRSGLRTEVWREGSMIGLVERHQKANNLSLYDRGCHHE